MGSHRSGYHILATYITSIWPKTLTNIVYTCQAFLSTKKRHLFCAKRQPPLPGPNPQSRRRRTHNKNRRNIVLWVLSCGDAFRRVGQYLVFSPITEILYFVFHTFSHTFCPLSSHNDVQSTLYTPQFLHIPLVEVHKHTIIHNSVIYSGAFETFSRKTHCPIPLRNRPLLAFWDIK